MNAKNEVGEQALRACLGLTEAEIRLLAMEYEERLVMTDPSTVSPGARVVLDGGLACWVAYDDSGRVFRVSFKEPRVLVDGSCRVGMTFAELIEHYPGSEPYTLRGYGTIVEPKPGLWFAFFPTADTLPPDRQVTWIEFRTED